MDEQHPVRRSGRGWNDIRFDGLSDLLLRARGCSVFDVGCNKGHVAYEFYICGARVVHGCDIDVPSIQGARVWFSEFDECESKFEVLDLQRGPQSINEAFGPEGYDIVLLLGVYHKLVRVMDASVLSELMKDLGRRSLKYFAWSGYEDQMDLIDKEIASCGLRQVHMSELAKKGMLTAIWRRE